jgi:hypothetical protein
MEEIKKKVNELLDDYSAANILDALISESPSSEMDGLLSTMESEVSYRSKYKMIKIETMDQEMKLEEFLDQLYPNYNDRSQATLI